MPDVKPILDIIKRGGYEASLITTFNANLQFYEEVVLRKLVSAGCRHNVILMDRSQCAVSWESEATRPKLAGYSYTLLPINAPGAFHPKICILVGPKKASILVGSHNLTLSGFGYNREITNWIDITGNTDAGEAAILKAVWQSIQQFIEMAQGNLDKVLIDAGLAMTNFVAPLIVDAKSSSDTFVLTQIPTGESLLDQVSEIISSNISKICVVGAFFDHELAFINELASRWPSADLVVGIDPESVHLSTIPLPGVARYVDARQLWPEGGYLHAKALYFLANDGENSAFVSGSANPSRPAWMGSATSCNVETIFIRIGHEANIIAKTTGLHGLFELDEIHSDLFEAISLRSSVETASKKSSTISLWIGVADSDSGELRFTNFGKQLHVDQVTFFDSDLKLLGEILCLFPAEGEIIVKPNFDILAVRSSLFYSQGEIIARGMIHHSNVISRNSQSSRQHLLYTALSSLGSNDGDISKVIASVERVIFSDETHKEIDVALREHKEKAHTENLIAAPETLAISVDDLPNKKKKLRFLKSGDLAYLIDVMMRQLSEGLKTFSIETDVSGRTEEEQVGQDDNNNNDKDELSKSTTATTHSDPEIAKIVASKSRSLVKRMVEQLKLAATNKSRNTTAVLQIIAVLALLRELRFLDKTPRWKKTGQSLAEEKDRRFLFDESLKYLLGSSFNLLDLVNNNLGVETEEVIQLKVLLLWLSWDLGEEFHEHIGKSCDSESLKRQLRANAFFLKLIPPIATNDNALAELEKSISRTINPTPEAAIRAQNWLNQHWAFGRKWSNGFEICEDLKVGGFCYIPNINELPQIVVELSSQYVGCWAFDKVRTFERSRALGVISN